MILFTAVNSAAILGTFSLSTCVLSYKIGGNYWKLGLWCETEYKNTLRMQLRSWMWELTELQGQGMKALYLLIFANQVFFSFL